MDIPADIYQTEIAARMPFAEGTRLFIGSRGLQEMTPSREEWLITHVRKLYGQDVADLLQRIVARFDRPSAVDVAEPNAMQCKRSLLDFVYSSIVSPALQKQTQDFFMASSVTVMWRQHTPYRMSIASRKDALVYMLERTLDTKCDDLTRFPPIYFKVDMWQWQIPFVGRYMSKAPAVRTAYIQAGVDYDNVVAEGREDDAREDHFHEFARAVDFIIFHPMLHFWERVLMNAFETQGKVATRVAFQSTYRFFHAHVLAARNKKTLYCCIAVRVWVDFYYARDYDVDAAYVRRLNDLAQSPTTRLKDDYDRLELDMYSYYAVQVYGPAHTGTVDRQLAVDSSLTLNELCQRRPEFADRIASFPLRIVADMEQRVLSTPSLMAQRVDEQEEPLALLARVYGWTVV